MVFWVNTKYIHKHNVILNKTGTRLVTILKKWCCFFSYLNPTSYLNFTFSFTVYFVPVDFRIVWQKDD